MSCFECGSIKDADLNAAIKEPRFMKATYHLDPYDLFKQMRRDQHKIIKKFIDIHVSNAGSDCGSNVDSREEYINNSPRSELSAQGEEAPAIKK